MGSLIITGAAVAAPREACPDVPVAYAGEDDAKLEARALRIAVAQSCHAMRDELRAVESGTTGVQGAVENVAPDLAAKLPGRDASNPAHVTSVDPPADGAQTVALSTEDRDRAELHTATLHGDLWFILGLAVAAFFGASLMRLVL